MARPYKLALIGFGNVAQGFTEILARRHSLLASNFGIDLRIVAVSDPVKGSVAAQNGLDPQLLLNAIKQDGNLKRVTAPRQNWDSHETIDHSEADIVIELSHTDLESGEPAISHVKRALQRGMHVITTNKGPVAMQLPALLTMARHHGVTLGIEGTVMSGTPCLKLGNDVLRAAGIRRIQGILNGTTNFILGRMEAGISYSAALEEAQALGYAEANPAQDIDGQDAAAKLVILGNLLMDLPIQLDQVERTSISDMFSQEATTIPASGKRWKLIGSIDRTEDDHVAAVRPEQLAINHPLAQVTGNTNAITFHTDLLGEVTLTGPGAGRLETGYAIVEDILTIHNTTHRNEEQP